MNRPWKIWLSFGLCLAVVAAAVGWLSLRALESERAEDAARQQATVDDNVRLALWRMDSALAVFLAQENARPFQEYFTSEAIVSLPPGLEMPLGEDFSPLLKQPPPRALVYFQIDADNRWSSPQVLTAEIRARAIGKRIRADQIAQSSRRLDELHGKVDRNCLLATAPRPAETDPAMVIGAITFAPAAIEPLPVNQTEPAQQSSAGQSRTRGQNDFNARSQYLTQNSVNAANFKNGRAFPTVQPFDAHRLQQSAQVGIMAPLVVVGELLLVRQVLIDGMIVVQGCWLDWPLLKGDLQATFADLLPGGQLTLVAEPIADDQGRMLASLPVRLNPGTAAASLSAGLSPVRLALIAAWGAMLVAAAAVAILLRGVVALSERRADFVSAVTHELRTPLTTFRMYAEMLSAGMVPDESRRRQYLDTLRVEADRLSHLVENVLAYARLERGGLGNRLQQVTGEQLVSSAGTRLAERAAQAHLNLTIDFDESTKTASVVADPSAVEQILFNLVDNACKYAGSAQDRSLHLRVRIDQGRFVLRVRDYGPGLPDELRGRLFQPFHKSAAAAAGTAPGVGLGLSLSRRLARDMHGDLRLDPTVSNGAAFELTLPLGAFAEGE